MNRWGGGEFGGSYLHGDARAAGADVDMGAGGLSGNRLAEGEVGNPIGDEILQQPLAFGLIGVDGDVDAAGVVEAERAMDGGIPVGGDGQWLAEFGGEGRLDMGQHHGA